MILRRGIDIGIIIQNGKVKMIGQPFQRGAGTGRTAGMQQQAGTGFFCVQLLQDLFHGKLIIDAVGHSGSSIVPFCPAHQPGNVFFSHDSIYGTLLHQIPVILSPLFLQHSVFLRFKVFSNFFCNLLKVLSPLCHKVPIYYKRPQEGSRDPT